MNNRDMGDFIGVSINLTHIYAVMPVVSYVYRVSHGILKLHLMGL